MTSYRLNEKKHGVEIIFDAKPSDEIRTELKGAGFRWNGTLGYWYATQSADRIALAARLAGGGASAPSAPSVKKPQPSAKKYHDEILAAYSQVWGGNERMTSYCMKKAAAVAKLPDEGGLVVIDKQGIETRFCFGESGYDYEDAQHAAENARTNTDYLKRENMKDFISAVDHIKENIEDPLPRQVLVLAHREYTTQNDSNPLRHLEYMMCGDVIEAFGGSVYRDQLRGTTFDRYGRTYYLPTLDDLKAILTATEEAKAAHEAKVDRYIKRYGTSKVHSWTYWIDA